MTIALLSVGTELTRGEVVDMNAPWLAAELTGSGFSVAAIELAPDRVEALTAAVQRLASRHRIVIATGGLGLTGDAVTAEAAARAAGVELVLDESALLAIRRRLEPRGRQVLPAHEKQAKVPAGAELLPNAIGTDVAFCITLGDALAFFLPGSPREMKRTFTEQVLPRFRPQGPSTSAIVRLRTYGAGASTVAAALDEIGSASPAVTLSYRTHFPEIDVRIEANAPSLGVARDHAQRAADAVRARIGDAVYGVDDEQFPEIVGRAVRLRGHRLAVAESCTGGLISHLLTQRAASDYFVGGAVTYANSAKTRLLGVLEDTVRGHGAVSAEVVAGMAEGVRRLCACEIGLAVTGIAGPTGGSADVPVGLSYWAVAHPGGTVVRHKVFQGDREEVQRAAAYAGLDLLRRVCAGLPY
ncbi:MAG TPA: CinA family nicotinamide mononucleotide deamidase-related protein [Minicystis sp.]|nr:CinA family nicotinamide mononucleotide deamidase-related protein [Minicystis sp.]